MKPFTSIFSRKPRPERPRKRPDRSLAMSFAPLESRALLTLVGPLPLSTAPAVFASLNAPQPPPNLSLTSSSVLNFGTASPIANVPSWNHPGSPNPPNTFGGGGSPDQGGAESPPEAPFDRLKNHVAVAELNITVNGVNTPVFALANAGESQVHVRIGNQVQTLGTAQGIDHPQSVMLTYLDDSGDSENANPYPDLIVANSGGNNVLIFPGLPGGQFGPSLNGPQGFEVGRNPVGITKADINGDGVPDLLVANQGSNSVTFLLGQTTGSGWGSNQTETINVGDQGTNTAPIKVLYADPNKDGIGDLIVCNSGSNNVYVYTGVGDGVYDTTNPNVFAVGVNPTDMFLGQFDRRPLLDLVTVNSGSDDVTLIGGIFTTEPTSQTISSGGLMPDAAFAFTTSQNGMMDLVIGNSGDGRLALLQAGSAGLQVLGVITLNDLPIPTGLAPSSWDGSGIEFIAASAGQDAADLLRFDLSTAFLTNPVGESLVTEGELVSGLMSFGESSFEMIAIFWAGSSDQEGLSDGWNLRDPSPITALYLLTEGQGEETSTTIALVDDNAKDPQTNLAESDKLEPATVNSFVTGVDLKLQARGEPIAALAADDRQPVDLDRSFNQIVRLDEVPNHQAGNPDAESADGTIDEILHLQMFEGRSLPGNGDVPIDPSTPFDPSRRREGIDTSAQDGRFETISLLSSVTLLSTRLILKVSPPRPTSFRKGGSFRIAGGKPESSPKT